MSRAPVPGETITVRPTNNIYTALAAVAVLVQILVLVVIFMRAKSQFGGLF